MRNILSATERMGNTIDKLTNENAELKRKLALEVARSEAFRKDEQAEAKHRRKAEKALADLRETFRNVAFEAGQQPDLAEVIALINALLSD